jgi:hypothetical protein
MGEKRAHVTKNSEVQRSLAAQLMYQYAPCRLHNHICNDAGCNAKNQYQKFETKIFPEKELRGHSSHFLIHVSVSDLYITTVGLRIQYKVIFSLLTPPPPPCRYLAVATHPQSLQMQRRQGLYQYAVSTSHLALMMAWM